MSLLPLWVLISLICCYEAAEIERLTLAGIS